MTSQPFEACAEAIAECAFATSDLPVTLSLEMHCSPKNQFRLTTIMLRAMGDALLPVRALPSPRLNTLECNVLSGAVC